MRNYIPVFNTALGCVCEQENKGQTPNNTKENCNVNRGLEQLKVLIERSRHGENQINGQLKDELSWVVSRNRLFVFTNSYTPTRYGWMSHLLIGRNSYRKVLQGHGRGVFFLLQHSAFQWQIGWLQASPST